MNSAGGQTHTDTVQPNRFVRPAKPEDAHFVAQLQANAITDLLHTALPAQDWTETVTAQMLQIPWKKTLSQPAAPNQGTLIAEESGVPVGFAAFSQDEDPEDAPDEAPDLFRSGIAILALEVGPEHRSEGHGSRLLSAISDSALSEKNGYLYVWLVPEEEERIRFFQSAGFGPIGLRRNLETGAGTLTEHLWFAALR